MELCMDIASALRLSFSWPIVVPGGFYIADQFHTMRGYQEDNQTFPGRKISEYLSSTGNTYDIIDGMVGETRAIFSGTESGYDGENYTWALTAFPLLPKDREDLRCEIYAQADTLNVGIVEPDSHLRH